MFVMIFYLISTQIASSANKKVSHPITISIEMKIEYISNFDFGKQTFDVIVEVEQSILQWIDIDKLQHDVGVGQTTSVFSDIQFDVIDSHTIGIVDYAVSRKNLTGMRKKEKLTVACHFSHYIPFDRHICLMKIIARKLSSDELILTWRSSPKLASASMNTPFLIVDKITSTTCVHKRALPLAPSTSTITTHSCLAVRFEFVRPFCLAFYRFYLPSSLVLFLAWVSFYVDRNDLVSRVLLLSFSIFFQIVVCAFFLLSVSLPVSAATPADVWCALLAAQSAVAVFFIYLSVIVESEVRKCRALSIGSKNVRDESRLRRERRIVRKVMYSKENTHTNCLQDKSTCSYSDVIESSFRRRGDAVSVCSARLDIVARIACPSMYIVLTSLYFFLYLLSP